MINEMKKTGISTLKFFLFFFAGWLSIGACNKNIDITGNKAYLSVTNLSPNAPPLSIIFENDTITTAAVPVDSTTGVPGNPYLTAFAGIHDFTIAGDNKALVNGNIGLQGNHYYSLFTYDSVSNGKINTLTLQDFLNTPADTASSIRFLNFSSNAISLYLQMTNSIDTILFSRVPFPFVGSNPNPTILSRLVVIKPGIYDIKGFLDSLNSPNSFNMGSLTFAGAKIYTIYTRADLSSTDTNSLGVIRHN